MITAILKEGLGNQLFQYAAGRCLAEKRNTTLMLDTFSFKSNALRKYALNNFNINVRICDETDHFMVRAKYALKNLFDQVHAFENKWVYQQKGLNFDKCFLNLPNGSCIEGYWQNEKYFKDIENIIRVEFLVVSKPCDLNASFLDKIKSSNSVSLHVRRGDYVHSKEASAVHGVCGLNYYIKAVNYIKEHITNPHFFVFSDDIPWAKGNLTLTGNQVDYIDHNGNLDHEDLRLMYNCKHNIIANSSFSWWGAWLNNNPAKIIIAPSKWFNDPARNSNDIVPENWVKI